MIDYQTEYPPKTEEITGALEQFVIQEIMPQIESQGYFKGIVEPGDATHYEIFGIKKGIVGGQELWYIAFMSGDYLGKSAVLPFENWMVSGYVNEKMGFRNVHTSLILTDIINLIIHFKNASRKNEELIDTELDAYLETKERVGDKWVS